MAKSTPKKRNLRAFPGKAAEPAATEETATAVMEPEAAPEAAETPFDETPITAPKKQHRILSFFERVAAISRKDWDGGRAKIRVYRLAPLITRGVGNETKFITAYTEPVTEEKIKIDHGSGKYRLYLGFKAPADSPKGPKERELDMIEINILDMNFPPKVPAGEWMNDERNNEWAWAKPAGAPGAQPVQAQPNALDSLETFMDIQDRIENRLKPPAAPTPAAAAPVDPWSAAEKILNMRADNPMIEIMKAQQTSAAAALEAERERTYKAQEAANERIFQLQQKLLEAKTAAPATTAAKGLLEQLMDAPEEKMNMIKRIFNWSTGGEGNGTTRRTTGLDIAKDLGERIFTGPVGEGIGQWIASRPAPTGPQVNGNGAAHQATAASPPPANDLAQFVQNVVNPALLSHYVRGLTGSDFAAWLADGYPDRLKAMQNFTHPLIPFQKGAGAIIQAYKNTASMWPTLSSQGEAAFTEFVREFCAWTPEQDEDEAIDIDGRTIEDRPEHDEEPERI